MEIHLERQISTSWDGSWEHKYRTLQIYEDVICDTKTTVEGDHTFLALLEQELGRFQGIDPVYFLFEDVLYMSPRSEINSYILPNGLEVRAYFDFEIFLFVNSAHAHHGIATEA